jgi:hypothetical protein
MSNMTTLFEEDAGALQVKNEDLSSIGALAKRAKELVSCLRKPFPACLLNWA